MQRVKALDELTPADLWREVPHEDDRDEFWEDTRERHLQFLKTIMEGALEEELTLLVGAGRYRRTEDRHGYRNGFYERDLATQIGIVTAIRVPRARTQRVEHSVFSRYQRRQQQVNSVIRDVFLAGVSTRRVGETLEALVGERVSAQTVSRVAQSLNRDVARFHASPLADDVLYLLLDGVYLRVKAAPQVQRKLVLCAYGITIRGERRLLDFRLGTAESQAQWEAFLSKLRERGLLANHLRLIVTDGCPGLHRALETVYPYVLRQLCWVHKLRNVANHLKRSQQQCLEEAKAIYKAETRTAAIQVYWEWARSWRVDAPKAVACLERDLESLLSFLDCPAEHRRMVRTTNAIERCFREVRRRTRPMTCFNNNSSCERITYAVFNHLNSRRGRTLPQFTHNA